MNPEPIREAMIECLGRPGVLDGVVEAKGQVPALPEELARRFGERPEMREDWCLLAAQVRALVGLRRLESPPDLDGRVVAALEAGHRQDRIADNLGALPRPLAPRELDARVRRMVEQPFADELSHEVAEKLEALVAARLDGISRSGSFRPVKTGGESRRSSGPRKPFAGNRLAVGSLLTAAALVVLVGRLMNPAADEHPGPVESYSFNIVRVESVDQADPALANLLDAMSGGMLAGRRVQ